MDLSDLLVWIVGFSCLGLVAQFLWIDRGSGRGWFLVAVFVQALTFGGVFLHRRWLTLVGEGAWVLLVLLPALLFMVYHRCQARQRYQAARLVSLLIRVLHPADGWKEVPELMRAMALAQRGELAAALDIYRRFEKKGGSDALLAAAQSFRIANRWEDFMEWRRDHLDAATLAQHPGLIPLVLRAFGETADPNGLAAWYEQFQERIERLPMAARNSCRLTLYAFCGRRAEVDQVLADALGQLPRDYQAYWKATVAQAAGLEDEARALLRTVIHSADHLIRGAALRRLEQPLPALSATLSEGTEAVLKRAERVQADEARFGQRGGLWTRAARATQILILANLVMFVVEMLNGGSMNDGTLIKLGALLVPEGRPPGWWWRLGSSLFLHFGVAHLAMNMLGLAWLGPGVERTLGRLKFLALYLLAGMGAGAAVLLLTSNRLLVGASGSIMALVGAAAAIALRAWLREKAPYASRRFFQFLIVIAAQTLFDIFTPRVSSVAHGAGLLLGFLLAIVLPHGAPARRPNQRVSS